MGDLSNQFKLYSVDTKAFYTEDERALSLSKLEITQKMNDLELWEEFRLLHASDISFEEFQEKMIRLLELKKLNEKTPAQEVELNELKDFFKKPRKRKEKATEYITAQEQKIRQIHSGNKLKKFLKKSLSNNEMYKELRAELRIKNKEFSEKLKEARIRELNPRTMTPFNQITLFENALSRAMDIQTDELVLDLVVVRAYHYTVLEQLIKYGFTYTDEQGNVRTYKVFTASAGQIRTKKVLFIEVNRWSNFEKTLMCGLTIRDINDSKEKGCNINKFLAYLALCNSATDKLEDFDIRKTIVIDDYETFIHGTVDYIDNKTFEVTRQEMDIPIPHSDGCGWTLKGKKNFMVRLPWVKGLLTPVNFIKFCDMYRGGNYKIVDIYGKEWDLKEDNIEIIFSKSQFKMYKYYKSWDDYVEKFIENGCQANYCNLEPDTKDFRKACFNYQMWQTLTDITDDEIAEFTDKVDEYITKGYSDRDTMLQILGADINNKKKTYLQQCLEIYPELLRDYHVKEELASTLNARKKEAKYGKFKINATYTFLLPDVFAWMEYVFLGEEKPKGLLKNNQVSCRLYKGVEELLVNRSPHLYREHAVRDNVVNTQTKEWFCTDGIYTSSHDLISKILQFDNDGDKALVVAEKTIIEVAKRNMEGIVPLYYEMGKASAKVINNDSIYESLTKAFSFNNIGKFSNKLTVLWNLDQPNLTTIAQITALNNFTIDGAKTLLVPEVPADVEQEMKEANGKLPYFFQFAKDKDKDDVAEINNSTVNRICRNIESIKQGTYDFKSVGKFNRRVLMNNPKIEIDDIIISKYKELERNKNQSFANAKDSGFVEKQDIYNSVYGTMKKEFIGTCIEQGIEVKDGVDMIVKYIYSTNRNCKKDFLFNIFGEIVLSNLKANVKQPLGEYIMCNQCGNRVKPLNNRQKYCDDCNKEILRQRDKEKKQRKRAKN